MKAMCTSTYVILVFNDETQTFRCRFLYRNLIIVIITLFYRILFGIFCLLFFFFSNYLFIPNVLGKIPVLPTKAKLPLWLRISSAFHSFQFLFWTRWRNLKRRILLIIVMNDIMLVLLFKRNRVSFHSILDVIEQQAILCSVA